MDTSDSSEERRCQREEETTDEVEPIFCDDDGNLFTFPDLDEALEDIDPPTALVHIVEAKLAMARIRAGTVNVPEGEDVETVIKALERGAALLKDRFDELDAE